MIQITKEMLRPEAPVPGWYDWAMSETGDERFTDVDGCAVHYLYWTARCEQPAGNLLLVHGGGGHAHWWSFIAPFFAAHYNVAAISLSGMGDSGRRPAYSADIRVGDMRGVIADAFADGPTFICGHSFGGYMTSRFGQLHGDDVAGIIVADSPFRPPEDEETNPRNRARMGNKRHYATFDEAWRRFRLMPVQDCANTFLVEHIGRHSLMHTPEGWCWKWDGTAMNNRRFGEPFAEYLAAATCRKAYLYGEKSVYTGGRNLAFAADLVGGHIVGVPEAQHHLMLDQPLATVAAVRGILAGWQDQDRR